MAQLDAPAIRSTEAWELRNARWLQVTFEAPQAGVLEHLADDVTRPVPCYARLFIVRGEEGPRGPLAIAALLAGGRFQMQPHNQVIAGVVEGEPADRISEAFGAGFQRGHITLERDGSSVFGSVTGAGKMLARAELPALQAAEAAMLRWDPWLTVGANGTGAALYQFALSPHSERSFLSKGASVTPADAPHDSPWWQLRSLLTISACYVEGAIVLGERTRVNSGT